MGHNISITWVADAASPSGGRSVMSQPIAQGLSPEAFWAAFERATMQRKIVGYEKAYACRRLGDGFLAMSTFPLPAGDIVACTTIHVDKAANHAIFRSFGTDASLNPSSLCCTSVLKLHLAPLRFEFWVDEHPGRRSNAIIAMALVEVLSKMSSKAAVVAACASPGSVSSERSVMSAHITDGATSAHGWLEFAKAQILKQGAKQQPDGSLFEIAKGWFMPTAYRRHFIDAAAGVLVTEDYASDHMLRPESLRSTSFVKVHRQPFRLELWTMQAAGRRSGEAEKDAASQILSTTLKHLE